MTISSRTVERCIEECLQCSRWCLNAALSPWTQDPIMMRDCIRLCNECLELCRTCVTLLTGSSGFAHLVCSICSELCSACAAECGKSEGETMTKCAQAAVNVRLHAPRSHKRGQFGGLLHKMKVWAALPRPVRDASLEDG